MADERGKQLPRPSRRRLLVGRASRLVQLATSAPGAFARRSRSRRVSLLAAVALAVLIGGALALMWFVVVRKIAGAGAQSIDVLKVAFTAVAGVGGAVALVVAYRRQNDLEQGRFVERFGAAAAQLGNSDPAVRIAGVYAMAGVADDSTTFGRRQQCINVLCGYLRLPYDPVYGSTHHSELITATKRLPSESAIRPLEEHHTQRRILRQNDREVRQTIVRVISAHLHEKAEISWSDHDFDFTSVVFEKAMFSEARFGGKAIFAEANFSGDMTSFRRTTFAGDSTIFDGAIFGSRFTVFDDANFAGLISSFHHVTFSGKSTRFVRSDFGAALTIFIESAFNAESIFFDKATFNSPLTAFNEVAFTGSTTSFSQAAFSGEKSSFNLSAFNGRTYFTETVFGAKETWFTGASFSGPETSFRGAIFNGERVGFQSPRAWLNLLFDWEWERGSTQPACVLPRDWPPTPADVVPFESADEFPFG